MIEGKHFRLEMVPAGFWWRLKGTVARGGDNEPRPHLIPKTEIAVNCLHMAASGFFNEFGLCPGEIALKDSSKSLAYRFITLDETYAVELIQMMDDRLDAVERDSKEPLL
jgi:hypothetical protein